MRLKITLFMMLFLTGVVYSQDTIRTLLITEVRLHPTQMCYLEITNMGDAPVDLKDFALGWWGGGNTLDYETGVTNKIAIPFPVDTLIAPGQSFVFAPIYEYNEWKWAQGIFKNNNEKYVPDNIWDIADYYVYMPEGGPDSLDLKEPDADFSYIFTQQWTLNGFFIAQMFGDGSQVVVDQVGGAFILDGGVNPDRGYSDGYTVAGVTGGSAYSVLIRRNSVKSGTLNWWDARGIGLDDSEWIPVPWYSTNGWRLVFWTLGNHGDYNLVDTTLVSDVIDVDFANKTLDIPYGVKRGDDIMNYFEARPGIAWDYLVGPTDSLTHAARTGDKLVVFVCGNDVDIDTFDITVKAPAADAKMLITVSDEEDNWEDDIATGYIGWPRIIPGDGGVDTITGAQHGIPYATRADSLLERLEKPSNATWEIIYNDGVEMPDLRNGDMIRVTANDGSTKDYYIKVIDYIPSDNALLGAITWPDIPEYYRGTFGWVGDTIPGFNGSVNNYRLKVGRLYDGIPALIATAANANASISVKRAKSLFGTLEDRTITFTVTAEDGSTENVYNIELFKEKLPDQIQPFYADPIISELVKNLHWQGSDYLEIYNPGNQKLDLSNYMIASAWGSDPIAAITMTNADNYAGRYQKYIPGKKWGSESEWSAEQYIAQEDLSVNKSVEPGDVFVMDRVVGDATFLQYPEYMNPTITQSDLHFYGYENEQNTVLSQWGENFGRDQTPIGDHIQATYLFKILNDSVKNGDKPATDPNDFILLDVIRPVGSTWEVNGVNMGSPFGIIRKEHIWKGNPVPEASNGTAEVPGEWYDHSRKKLQEDPLTASWPANMLLVASDIGNHFAISPTQYISTVSSNNYLVSMGYSHSETIRGVETGTTVDEVVALVDKNDSLQSFIFKSASDTLAGTDVLVNGDSLIVYSADSSNITKYIIEVTDEGLNSDALLSSSTYTVTKVSDPADGEFGEATITGMSYGTLLKAVYDKVSTPVGASIQVIDDKGAYLPFKIVNYDSMYVDVTANTNAFFLVTAEDGLTQMLHQIKPEANESDAFITSNVFTVNQNELLISDVPNGIATKSFKAQIFPVAGATFKVVDKLGFERVDGQIADDDRVVVTSADETNEVTYFINRVDTDVYYAYIVSEVYSIDQVAYIVTIDGSVSLSDFEANITLSAGATLKITDQQGVEKTDGNLENEDIAEVTSADGMVVTKYTISVNATGLDLSENHMIELFPNPSRGLLNITGLSEGQTLQLYNTVGNMLFQVKVNSDFEVISLDQYSAGFYIVVVSDNNKIIGNYKVVKK